jgi:hypothetical protein
MHGTPIKHISHTPATVTLSVICPGSLKTYRTHNSDTLIVISLNIINQTTRLIEALNNLSHENKKL